MTKINPARQTHDPYLDAYLMHATAPEIVPGNSRRDWMDQTTDRYAYRCLPLTMANSTGWDILCPFDIDIVWKGGEQTGDITISSPTHNNHVSTLAVSHFGFGIVTFHTGYLFRTPPGWAVWCMGPPNWPKEKLYPLSGLVETDWLPFPFTMNWRFTEPGLASFKKGEPFCFVTLMEHKRMDEVEPKIKSLSSNPQLEADSKAWHESRETFIKRLNEKDPDTLSQGWQRHYMKGEAPSGTSGDSHMTRRRLKPPRKE